MKLEKKNNRARELNRDEWKNGQCMKRFNFELIQRLRRIQSYIPSLTSRIDAQTNVWQLYMFELDQKVRKEACIPVGGLVGYTNYLQKRL